MSDKLKPQEIDELTFTIKELRPILRTWALGLMGQKGKGPRKDTDFPDIKATLPDGSDGTLEELLKEHGAVPIKEDELMKILKGEKQLPKPPDHLSSLLGHLSRKTDGVFVELALQRPSYIPARVWKTEFFQNRFRWLIRNYCVIKAVNRDNEADQRIVYDPKRDKGREEIKEKSKP